MGRSVGQAVTYEAVTLTWIGMGTAFLVLVALALLILVTAHLMALPSRIAARRTKAPAVTISKDAEEKALAAVVAVSALLTARQSAGAETNDVGQRLRERSTKGPPV